MKQQVFNPFLPSWEYVPDGEPRVFGDRLYLYGSHDLFNGADFCLGDYVCWSAPLEDLSDWRYEGVIYRAAQDPRNADGKMHMCAPDCVQGPDGRYYLYYQLHILTCTCVAVADSPVGPFEYYGCVHHPDGTPWGEKKGDSFAFDPGVLVDDDGKVYLYVGHSPAPGFYKTVLKLRGNRLEESVCLELEPDMITVRGGEHPIVPGPVLARGTDYEGHGFFEASSIRKIGKKYYYVYSSILSHELCYAVSDKPTEGFRYGGTLVSIADIGYKGNQTPLNYTGNTHGGMCEVNGQWYIFYHRQTNCHSFSRQACAEKLTCTPEGGFKQAEVTSCGLNQGPLAGLGKHSAGIACNLWSREGTARYDRKFDKEKHPYITQTGRDGDHASVQYIANMRDGSIAGFKYFEFSRPVSVQLDVRGKGTGKMEVSDDPAFARIAATIPVDPSHSQTMPAVPLELTGGVRALYFRYKREGAVDFYSFELK